MLINLNNIKKLLIKYKFLNCIFLIFDDTKFIIKNIKVYDLLILQLNTIILFLFSF